MNEEGLRNGNNLHKRFLPKRVIYKDATTELSTIRDLKTNQVLVKKIVDPFC